ncbi:hypothetical protein [Rubripirellula reticaptiva]|nr:hypothetical protein [Rubripirellula reticaptiva]
MKKTFCSLVLPCAVLFLLVFIAGCGSKQAENSPAASAEHDDHDHDDHAHDDHDDHAGHDHPAHGPNGGHMVELSGGGHAEWAHDDDKELITVYPENADQVTKVEMKVTIDDKATNYSFAKSDDDGLVIYTLTSPELLTAIKMGDAVKTELVISTDDGDMTGKVAHHAH